MWYKLKLFNHFVENNTEIANKLNEILLETFKIVCKIKSFAIND